MTRLFTLCLLALITLAGCTDDDDLRPALSVPSTYTFERAGATTVSFTGQSERIAMAEELTAGLSDPVNSEEALDNQFRNEGPGGEDVDPFADPSLNASGKSIRSKVAASADYFAANATGAAVVRQQFDGLIGAQVAEVFPRWNELAAPGLAGQVSDGSSTRYVNGRGLEYNQVFAKSLIGALMVDQMLNNYLSTAVLDEADNRATNNAGEVAAGSNYTTMEHKWDEAYGYLFGGSADPANPLATLGDDSFLNKYLGRVDDDPDFAGYAERVFSAFLRGRAAIVAGDYDERDAAAAVIRQTVSEVIAIRAIYYLAGGADAIENDPSRGSAFHDLSEGYGFVYSLQFTRRVDTGTPYFSAEEVSDLLAVLTDETTNGLWEVKPADLRAMAQQIATRVGVNYEAAAN